MSEVIAGDDLEKQIILMEQELLFKRTLLDECREKLNSEISQHAQAKVTANKYLTENKELQVSLNVYLAGTQKLEEENKKNRDSLVKLQVQFNAYLTERQQILDNCYKAEKENAALKAEVAELKEQLKGYLIVLENCQKRKAKTEALVSQIISKQEMLNKEQVRLENVCKEGLRFAEKLSEESKFQMKYVQEAKIGQVKIENEIIRLLAAITELKFEKEKSNKENVEQENVHYLELWKSYQKEMIIRNEEQQEVNNRLREELSFSREQLERLMKKC